MGLLALVWGASASVAETGEAVARLRKELEACPFKVVCESFRDGNWELVLRDANGGHVVNLTQTPDQNELFPHASPDGTKIAFLQDEGEGANRLRNVYYMNLDGSGRVKVAEDGQEPFWSPDGKIIAFTKQPRGPKADPYINHGLYFYNVETKEITQHPNKQLSGLLNPCWSPDGRWIVASGVRAMGFNESIVAIEANGPKIVELNRSCSDGLDLHQCRPDLNPFGNRVAWGSGNTGHQDFFYIEVADIDLTRSEPAVSNRRKPVTVDFPQQTYHVDWSPDGKYLVYTQGAIGSRMEAANYVIGRKASGWDLWVVNPGVPDVCAQISRDGLSNKEPDWVFVRK